MTLSPRVRARKREIFGWAMFDFANQAYTLLIITVVFGALFTQVVVGDRGDDYRLGNLLWSLALAVSYLLVVLTAPLAGAVMDSAPVKKRFLFFSYLLTILTTGLLYFVAPGYIWLGVVLIIFSNYAYSIGESFIASFLPFLGPAKDMGKISGFGWALGYVGGLVSAGFVIVFLGEVSAENFERIRWVGPFAAVFFLVAAIPTFIWLREPPCAQRRAVGNPVRVAVRRIGETFSHLRQFRDLMLFFGSLFFAMAGVYIIVAFAFIYGAQVIGWDEATRTLMFVVVQITATLGAVVFGLLQDRIGTKLTYTLTLGLWIAAILAIFFTLPLTTALNQMFGTAWQAQHVFVFVGTLAGLSLGSSQSAGRALVGILTPHTKAAEVFGFWGLVSKLAACFGLLGLGVLQTLVGLQASLLFCIALFGTAIGVSLLVDEKRGHREAEAYEQEEGR